MSKKILRGAWYVISSIIKLPITVIGLIVLIIMCIIGAIRFHDPINAWLDEVFKTMLESVKASIKWIKTGERT